MRRPGPVIGVVAGILAALIIAGGMVITKTGWVSAPTIPSVPGSSVGSPATLPPALPADIADRLGGLDGVGDPYLPQAGGSGFDVVAYDVAVTVNTMPLEITGTATVHLRVDKPLDTIHLDLQLAASSVRGSDKEFSYTQEGEDLAIGVGSRVPGDQMALTIAYAGTPDVSSSLGTSVYAGVRELLIAGEPQGAAAWYPANDHPSDPALYTFSVSVLSGVEAICAGTFVDTVPDPVDASREVWTWKVEEPTVTYATMLAVGHYDVDISRVTVGGRDVQWVSAVTATANTVVAQKWLKQSVAAANLLVDALGPYPASSLGGVIPPQAVEWGALETWGRPIYNKQLTMLASGESIAPVIIHELAHFWFGDTVTLSQWDDIVLNEGLAQWCEDYLPATDPNKVFIGHWLSDQSVVRPDAFPLGDPGPGANLFAWTVYDRGAMMVQGLRNVLGEDAFWPFLRGWASQTGPHTLEQFRFEAQSCTSTDLSAFFDAWLTLTTLPPHSPEFGYPA